MIDGGSRFSLVDQEFPLSVLHANHDGGIGRHSHDFWEFVYVDRGFSMHRVGGGNYVVMTGDLFYVTPGTAHEYWKSVNNSVYNCVFYPEALGCMEDSILRLNEVGRILRGQKPAGWEKIHLEPVHRFEVLKSLTRLEEELHTKPPEWKLRSSLLLSDFLICLERTFASDPAGESRLSPSGRWNRILSEVEASAENRCSVEELSARCGYSPEHFSRIIKKMTGLSPSAYINSIRIAKAAGLLAGTECTISQAAEAAGFDDLNYFSRLFKKGTGKTPTEFRALAGPG